MIDARFREHGTREKGVPPPQYIMFSFKQGEMIGRRMDCCKFGIFRKAKFLAHKQFSNNQKLQGPTYVLVLKLLISVTTLTMAAVRRTRPKRLSGPMKTDKAILR